MATATGRDYDSLDVWTHLEQERVRSGEVVVAGDGKVYVRWSD